MIRQLDLVLYVYFYVRISRCCRYTVMAHITCKVRVSGISEPETWSHLATAVPLSIRAVFLPFLENEPLFEAKLNPNLKRADYVWVM